MRQSQVEHKTDSPQALSFEGHEMIRLCQLRSARIVAGAVGAVALLAGCSSTSSSGSVTTSTTPDPTSTISTPSTATPTVTTTATSNAGECSEASILSALPAKLKLKDFDCAIASPAIWAAARVTSGPEVYFLESTAGPWKLYTSEKICSGAVKGVPKEILAYCAVE